MGPTHRVAGVAAWLALTPVLPVMPWQVGVGAVIAGATANGRLSPDMDQSYYLSSRFIPGGHRGVTHWWVWPLLMFAAGLAPPAWWLLPVAVAWGLGHVLLDAICGAVPTWPARRRGWEYAGLRLKTGGGTEIWLIRPLLVLAVPALASLDVWLTLGGAR